MKNLIHPPEDSNIVPKWTNSTGADVASGQPVVFGGGIMVAQGTIANNAVGSLLGGFIHEYTKVTAEVWTVDPPIYYDTTNKRYTSVAPPGTIVFAGYAHKAAANGDTKGQVRLLMPSGLRVVSGQHTTVAASDTVVTGLRKVLSAVAVLDDAPVAGAQHAQASIGDQAGTPASGSILVKTWKATAAGDTALIAATTFTKKVNWIAWGY